MEFDKTTGRQEETWQCRKRVVAEFEHLETSGSFTRKTFICAWRETSIAIGSEGKISQYQKWFLHQFVTSFKLGEKDN